MRVKKSILLSIVTLAVLSLGFFLPDILSFAQSKSEAATKQQYAVETIRLQAKEKPVDLFDVLRLASNEHNVTRLSNGNRLDKAGAYKAAMAALEFISEYVMYLEPEKYVIHEESPMLAFTEDGEAAIVWECIFSTVDDNNRIHITLDDKSGKMISVLYFIFEKENQNQNTTFAYVTSVNNWAELCMKYYEFDSYNIKTKTEGLRQRHDIAFEYSDGKILELSYNIDYYKSSTSDGGMQIQGYSAMSFNNAYPL